VDLLYDDSDAASGWQERRLERSLARLFPAGCGLSLIVDVAWSEDDELWNVRRARVVHGVTGDPDATENLRDSLRRDGLPVSEESRPAPRSRHAAVLPSGRGTTVRRTPRLLRRVPLRLESDLGVGCEATTVAVNAHGALLLSPETFPADSRLWITNLERGSTRPCRVVWSGAQRGSAAEAQSPYRLGVELLQPDAEFWDRVEDTGADD
jgi:hypothetical protein